MSSAKKLRLFSFKNRILKIKNKLKYEKSIKKENIISLKLVLTILSISLTGKNPPEEIIVIEILKASKVLRLINFNKINKKNVKDVYNIKILNDCLNVSE